MKRKGMCDNWVAISVVIMIAAVFGLGLYFSNQDEIRKDALRAEIIKKMPANSTPKQIAEELKKVEKELE